MKRNSFTRLLSLLSALCLLGMLFIGCEKKSVNGTCTVVLAGDPETEYTVDLDDLTVDNGLFSVLDHLSLHYHENGGMLTEVESVKQDTAAGIYVYLWTSVEADQDVSEYKSTKVYGDLTLVSAGIGAKDMTITDGAVIYIGTVAW